MNSTLFWYKDKMECEELCPYNTNIKIECDSVVIPGLTQAQAESIILIDSNGNAELSGHRIVVKSSNDKLNLKEICIQEKANQIGVGPKILGAWECEHKSESIIVTQYTPGKNLKDYIRLANRPNILTIYLNLVRQLTKLNYSGIIHNSSDLENFIVNKGRITITNYDNAFQVDAENFVKSLDPEEETYSGYYFSEYSNITRRIIDEIHIAKKNIKFGNELEKLKLGDGAEAWKNIFIKAYKLKKRLPTLDELSEEIRKIVSIPVSNILLEKILSCQSDEKEEWFIKSQVPRVEYKQFENDHILYNVFLAWAGMYGEFREDPNYECNLVITRHPDGKYDLSALAIHKEPYDVDFQNNVLSATLNRDQLIKVVNILAKYTVYNKRFEIIWKDGAPYKNRL